MTVTDPGGTGTGGTDGGDDATTASLNITFIGTNNHDFSTLMSAPVAFDATTIPEQPAGSDQNGSSGNIAIAQFTGTDPIGGSTYGKSKVTIAQTDALAGYILNIRFFRADSTNESGYASSGPAFTIDGDALALADVTGEAATGMGVSEQTGFEVRVWKEAKATSEPEPEPEDSDGIIINKNSDFQNVALGTAEDIDGWFFQKTDHADFEFIADTTDTANTLLKVTVTGIESAPNPWAIQVASSQNEIKANTGYLFKTRFYVNASNGDETAKINFSTNTVGVHKYGMTVNTGEWIELSISENPVVIEQNVIANVGLHLSHNTQINGDLIYIDYIRVIELVSNKLPTPTLSFPVDQQENVGTLTEFSWNRVDSATFYRLQLSGNSSFNSTILDTSGIESTVFTISNPLNENTKYYWRIMGISDNEENNSDWSNEHVFTTGVRTSIENNSLPNNYILFQNYPNPFNPNTEIQYALPESNQVTLEVFNSLGQKVMELVNSYKSAGYHREIFDASNLSSGVYLYKLTTASFTKTNKMLLIK